MTVTEIIIAFAAVCGALVTIWNLIEKVSKPIKQLSDKIKETSDKLDDLYKLLERQKSDIDNSKEERALLCEGVRQVCLFALEQGANDEIKKVLDELNHYLFRHAHN